MPIINLNDTTPAAPTGRQNVEWQADSSSPRNVSAHSPNIGAVDARTGTSETVGLASQGKLVTFSNSSPVAITLDNAAGGGFFCALQNLGTGAVTATPSSGTINGAANLVLQAGSGAWVFFDGANWEAVESAAGAGGATALTQTVAQAGHGFGSAGAFVAAYYTGSAWAKAKADNQDTLGTAIAVVIDADHFYLYTEGTVTGLSGLSAGEYYFVSDATAGLLTVTEPTSTSSYSNPLMQALSATTGLMGEFRPSQILPIAPQPVPVQISTGAGPIADPGGNDYYLFNNHGALTFDAPAGATTGMQRAYCNYAGITRALTVQMASGNVVSLAGVDGSSTGTIYSAGAAGDAVLLVCDSSNHWTAFVILGLWTAT